MVEKQFSAGFAIAPSGACFTSPFFLLAALLPGSKTAPGKISENEKCAKGNSFASVDLAQGYNAFRYEVALEWAEDSNYYTAFGEDLYSSGSTTHDFKYVGEQSDANAGFYYLRARWMDPKVGRFVSVDPYKGKVGKPLSQHRYFYADQSPAYKKDPSGELGYADQSAAAVGGEWLEAGYGAAVRMGGKGLWSWFTKRLVIGAIAAAVVSTTLTEDSWDNARQREWELEAKQETPERMQHYTTEVGYNGIRGDGAILPRGGRVFLTPGVYFDSESATQELAVCDKREWAVSLKVYRKADGISPDTRVAPVSCDDGTTRSGNGWEASTANPIYLGIYREPIVWWPLTD